MFTVFPDISAVFRWITEEIKTKPRLNYTRKEKIEANDDYKDVRVQAAVEASAHFVK
jgi:hypothetical protein